MTKLIIKFSVIQIFATDVKLLLNDINVKHCKVLKFNTYIFARYFPSGSDFQLLI